MKLFGPATATWETLDNNLHEKDASDLFRFEIAPMVWRAAVDYHVDPVGAVAQSYKETGAGRFGGVINHRWFNTCGLKVRDQNIHVELQNDKPLAHAMFPNWRTGAVAQVQHIRAYGAWALSVDDVIVDPRYVWVMGKHKCEEWSDLGGRWAPSLTYGEQIENIMRELIQ